MIKKVNHIGIVVNDIEKALIPYPDSLNLACTGIEYNKEFNVRFLFIPIGDTRIELIQPLSEKGDLAEFLKKNHGGLHHLAFEVDKIEKEIYELAESGIKMKDRTPKSGANNSKVVFIEKDEFDGAIIELVQPSEKVT